MITVATADDEIALQIGEVIEGRRSYIMKAKSDTNFRHQVHQNQPLVLVVDARLGGSSFEAVHGLPKIIENVKSKPLCVVLLPDESEAARSAALDFGAYEVVVTSVPSWLENLAEAVTDARVSRLAGLLPRCARQDLVVFH